MILLAALGLLSLASLLITGTVIGGRLILLSVRTGQLPERALGAALLMLSFGELLLILFPTREAGAANLLGELSIDVGFFALAVWLMLTFRRDDALGRVLVAAIGAALVAGDTVLSGDVAFWSDYTTRTVVYVWSFTEAALYYARMQRRARIGLSEPAVVHRFRDWALSAVAGWVMHTGLSLTFLDYLPTTVRQLAGLIGALAGLPSAYWIWRAIAPARSASTVVS